MPTLSSNHLAGLMDLLGPGLLGGADGVLARIWLMGPGDLCAECALRDECADRRRCLHLVKSAGTTARTDGPFRRFPIGAREVGRVPVTLETFVANDGLDRAGLADRTWLMAHDVRAFAAAPIVVAGACAGVVAVFSRSPLDPARVAAIEAMAALAGHALGIARAAPAPPRPALRRPLPEAAAPPDASNPAAFDCLRAWSDIEREVLERVLAHTGGRVSGPRGAAAVLGLKPTTLQSRLKKLGVRRARG